MKLLHPVSVVYQMSAERESAWQTQSVQPLRAISGYQLLFVPVLNETNIER